MADLEDVTLDGRPLQSLRVADLKAALEERGLPKSGQKNALVKRLKGALMLENLQKTSTPHVGLQPNSQIGEEMSQNSIIKQYLAKQQELLRQRLEREAREANDTNEQEEHTDVNNSVACPPQAQDVTPASADQHKPPALPDGEIRFAAVNEGEANSNQEAHMSAPPASGSITMHAPANEHQPEKSSAASDFPADSDDDDSEDAEEDGDDDDDDDWGSNIRRRTLRQPARGPSTRERCGASRQPQQPQHIPSLLSPQLRQPTPPPSPPPELSFSLPDTPKQSPPSPDVAPARHSPSTSSSGSSSSDSRSSSPEPQRSGHVERKPGPLTLLARKMESEGAFSGTSWPGGNGEGGRKDSNSSIATSLCGTEHVESLSSATAAGHVPVSMITGMNQGIIGTHSALSHIPVSVLKTSTMDERESELESENALEQQRQERLKGLGQEQALEEACKRALERERKEIERFEHQQAFERKEQEALQLEKKLSSESEKLEREHALAKEQDEREQTLERERALERRRELEKQRASEQERFQWDREEREKREKEIELKRIQALEWEREEREKALEKEKLERQKTLEAERKENEWIERQRALEQERLQRKKLEQERLEKDKALEQERLEREKEREEALEKQRQEQEALEEERKKREEALKEQKEREKALELERREKEKASVLERIEKQRALDQERLEKERLEQERLEQERQEQERQEQERLAKERLAKERLEQERLEQERMEQERLVKERLLKERLEQERLAKERLEQERLEQERLEQECLEQERLEQERLEQERLEQKRLEQERLEQKRLEQERQAKERLEQERLEQERQEQERLEQERLAQERKEQERLAKERKEQERLVQERLEQERLEQERLAKERKEQERLEQERLEQERLEQERLAKERLEQERQAKERQAKERQAKERQAKERQAKERQAKERQVKERQAKERQAKERLEQERLEQERLKNERRERACLEQKRLENERLERTVVERREQERVEKEHLERARVEEERLERVCLERASVEQEQLAQRLESDKAEEQERLKRDRKEQEGEASNAALERRIDEKFAMGRVGEQEVLETKTVKESGIELPPVICGSELGLIPPTPPLFTGPDRKTEAEVQEDAKAPMSQSESQAAESRTSLSSPQSSLKKFRFLRDLPIQAQSTTSMIIKRHRTFSNTPPSQVPLFSSPANFGKQQESETSAEQERHIRQQVITNALGQVGTQSEEESAFNKKTSSKEGFTNQVLEDIVKDDSVRQDEPAKEINKKLKDPDKDKVSASPVNTVQRREKRSSSTDSTSSESDSGSSSSCSSSSSSSSVEEISTSRNRREGKHDRSASPQCRVTAVAQDVSMKETQKVSPYKRERSVEKTNTADDEASQAKKPFIETSTEDQMKRQDGKELEETDEQRQGIESAMAESETLLEASEEAQKSSSARKISLSSTGSTDGDQECGTAGGRKRRWGSSTVVTAKKTSISITTDSLKSLIPDVRPGAGQDAVVDLHPEEVVLSGAEEEDQEPPEQDLQIRRTVTQEVPSDSQENGQKQSKRRRCEDVEENDIQVDHNRTESHEEKPVEDTETPSPAQPSQDGEISAVVADNTLIRRSISQQQTGVSITIDDPVRPTRQQSTPRGTVSSIVHVSNLVGGQIQGHREDVKMEEHVRPFTLGQLKELLGRTGTLTGDGFWIDKIKSHCYVTYSRSEEAIATREALHGVKWPQSNPKVLNVDFCQQDELDFHKRLGAAAKPGTEEQRLAANRFQAAALPSLLPKRDQWAEREREMERREKARSEREWDRDKVREFGKPANDGEGAPRRSRSRERRRKERGKSKEKKTEKKEKAAAEPPAKLLDDLFRKTKAAPCIYWLPLTDEQFVEREAARAERMKEREKRLKQQQQEEEEKKGKEERKERSKGGSVATGDRSEGPKDKERERERDRDRGKERETDKHRDGYRRPGASGERGSRRSRSRSDPRDRRR